MSEPDASAMPTTLYVYRARLERVVDGDPIDVTISLGLHDYRLERLRLLGVNAPEVHGPSRPAGLAATEFTADWLTVAVPPDDPDGWPLVIRTTKSDAFGRFLCSVWRTVDGRNLNADLLASGNAVPFARGP